MNSPEYARAKAFVEGHPSVAGRLGDDVRSELVPTVYRIAGGAADFEFRVASRETGLGGEATVHLGPGPQGARVTSASFAVRGRDSGARGEIVARWRLR